MLLVDVQNVINILAGKSTEKRLIAKSKDVPSLQKCAKIKFFKILRLTTLKLYNLE